MQVSVNFMDGADGVAAGVVAIVAMVAMLAAINRIVVPGDLQSGVVILSAALMGVCAGFLVFNLPPARTFMGDTGSHFLGVVLAAITIVGIAKVAVGLSILVPLIALGLPISDTAWAIVRRRRAGLSPTTPDAGHLHHRLQARGMTPMETALTFYFTTGVLGCLGLAIFGHRTILDVAIGLCALGVVDDLLAQSTPPAAAAAQPAAAPRRPGPPGGDHRSRGGPRAERSAGRARLTPDRRASSTEPRSARLPALRPSGGPPALVKSGGKACSLMPMGPVDWGTGRPGVPLC